MAGRGGSGFGWFIIGAIVGAVGVSYGPTHFRTYVQQQPVPVRVEVANDYTPGVWRRMTRIDIEFSRKKANGQNWDLWPMTEPELQVCIVEGTEYRKCYGPLSPELAACQGRYRCVTEVIKVPDVPFAIELNEWDDYNRPDPIGRVDCDVGFECRFPLGRVKLLPVTP